MSVIWTPTGPDLWFDLTVKLTWKDILKSSSLMSEYIGGLQAKTLTAHLIPGPVNPSDECYLNNWYTGGTFRAAEFEAIFNTLKKMLLN